MKAGVMAPLFYIILFFDLVRFPVVPFCCLEVFPIKYKMHLLSSPRILKTCTAASSLQYHNKLDTPMYMSPSSRILCLLTSTLALYFPQRYSTISSRQNNSCHVVRFFHTAVEVDYPTATPLNVKLRHSPNQCRTVLPSHTRRTDDVSVTSL